MIRSIAFALLVCLSVSPALSKDYWGPPYSPGAWFGPTPHPGEIYIFPSIAAAADYTFAWHEDYYHQYDCSYYLEDQDPVETHGTIAEMKLKNNPACVARTDPYGYQILAKYYPTFPGKDAGGPCGPCKAGDPYIGNPINLATGNKFQPEQDYESTGPLDFYRFYNSSLGVATAGDIGSNWRHSFSRSLKISMDGQTASVYQSDGKYTIFKKGGNSDWIEQDPTGSRLEASNQGDAPVAWQFFSVSAKSTDLFDSDGRLLESIDKNGRKIFFKYQIIQIGSDSKLALAQAEDETGRAIYFERNAKGNIAKIKFPDDTVATYRYDSEDRLIETEGGKLIKRTYHYNETSSSPESRGFQPLLTGITDARGIRVASFGYGEGGEANSTSHANGIDSYTTTKVGPAYNLVNPLGGLTTFSIDTEHDTARISGASKPCGKGCAQRYSRITYDAAGNPEKATDFRRVETKFTYTQNGLEQKRVEASGSVEERSILTTWSTNANRLAQNTFARNGDIISSNGWAYNARNQQTAACTFSIVTAENSCEAIGPGANTKRTTLTYCDSVNSDTCPIEGLLQSVDGPRTDIPDITTTRYYMDTNRSGCGTAGAECHTKADIKSIQFANGMITKFPSYDKGGKPTRVIGPNDEIIDYEYDQQGNLVTTIYRIRNDGATDPGDAVERRSYDLAGNITAVTDPDGVKIIYVYDDASRLVGRIDSLGNRESYTLDAMGNLLKDEISDTNGVIQWREARTYDSQGNLLTIADGLNRIIFNASGGDSHDPSGNLLKFIDGRGVTHTSAYDSLNRLKNIDRSYFEYYANDRVKSFTDADFIKTNYALDDFGEIAARSLDGGVEAYTYTADLAGNRVSETRPDGKVIRASYDMLNRVLEQRYNDSTQNISYRYDEPNTLTGCSQSSPKGRVTRVLEHNLEMIFCYDKRGRVTQRETIQNGLSKKINYQYSPGGRITALTVTSLGTISYFYDINGNQNQIRLTGIDGASQTLVSNVTRAPFGPITSFSMGDGSTYTRTLDLNYNVISIKSSAIDEVYERNSSGEIFTLRKSSGEEIESYTYDDYGRLTSVKNKDSSIYAKFSYTPGGDRLSANGNTAGAGSYYYSGHNLLLFNSNRWTSDPLGFVTNYSQGGGSVDLKYNDRGMLSNLAISGINVADYTYNAFGERVRKLSSFMGTDTVFGYDEEGKLVAEYGPTLRRYIYLDNLPVATYDPNSSIKLVFLHSDGIGSPRAATDLSGKTVWTWSVRQNPFGEARPIESGYSLSLRFPGQYFDAESDLVYNGHRYYNPSIGRYMQPDPLGLTGQINPFEYANSSPLVNADPLGMAWVTSGPRRDDSWPTIVCDGHGGIMPALGNRFSAQQMSCFGDCIEAHERKHAEDAMYQTPSVCYNKVQGLQVLNPSSLQTAQAEVDAYQKRSIPCLRNKLKNQNATKCTTDECQALVKEELERELNLSGRYSNFLNLHQGSN